MCNVKATSEISFNAHINGKKHNAKEGRTQVQTTREEPNQREEDHKEKLDHPVNNIDKNLVVQKKKKANFDLNILDLTNFSIIY